jgi:hypothetical protein
VKAEIALVHAFERLYEESTLDLELGGHHILLQSYHCAPSRLSVTLTGGTLFFRCRPGEDYYFLLIEITSILGDHSCPIFLSVMGFEYINQSYAQKKVSCQDCQGQSPQRCIEPRGEFLLLGVPSLYITELVLSLRTRLASKSHMRHADGP